MNNLLKPLVFLYVSSLVLIANAQDSLDPEEVFNPEIINIDKSNININIPIPPDYYLYREQRFDITSENEEITITDLEKSPGTDKYDEYLGTQSVWYGGKNTADISVSYENPNRLKQSTLIVKYQGCHDKVLCYPPKKTRLLIELPPFEKADDNNQLFKDPSTFSSAKKHSSPLIFDQKQDDVLSAEEAFPFSVERINANTLKLSFNIADGYYLYQDKVKITATDINSNTLINDIKMEQAEIYHDEFYGKQHIYRGKNTIAKISLSKPSPELILTLQFQGCAEKGICYPVINRQLKLIEGTIDSVTTLSSNDMPLNTLDKIGKALKSNLWVGITLLLLAGLALAFTPCVLPMLPILLGIITNQRKISKIKSLYLSSAYALGVATMMAIFGLVVAKTGINIQIIFQKPLWLILFASLFIAMGLSMLGFFSIAMPNSIQSKAINWQNRFQNTNVFSMFVVGSLSTLVVGPCVAPPLIAVLAFISTTGNSLFGAVYLFSLGLGMSLPLIIFASLITTIPKVGALSRLVTRLFAALMLGVALWLLSRIMPGALALSLWGIYAGGLAWIFWKSQFHLQLSQKLTKLIAILIAAIGLSWLSGGLMGNSNPLKPFTKATRLPFTIIDNLSALEKKLSNSTKPIILDLYADWCVSCQEVEHLTLTNPEVIKQLHNFTLLKLDITNTTEQHRLLLKQLDLIGPPAMLFFENSKEFKHYRQVGPITANELLKKIESIQKKNPSSM